MLNAPVTAWRRGGESTHTQAPQVARKERVPGFDLDHFLPSQEFVTILLHEISLSY